MPDITIEHKGQTAMGYQHQSDHSTNVPTLPIPCLASYSPPPPTSFE